MPPRAKLQPYSTILFGCEFFNVFFFKKETPSANSSGSAPSNVILLFMLCVLLTYKP